MLLWCYPSSFQSPEVRQPGESSSHPSKTELLKHPICTQLNSTVGSTDYILYQWPKICRWLHTNHINMSPHLQQHAIPEKWIHYVIQWLEAESNVWVFCTTLSLHLLLLLRVGRHTWSSQGSGARGCQQLTEVFITQVGPAMTIVLCGEWERGTSYWATVYTRPRLFLVGSLTSSLLPRHRGLKRGLDSWYLLEMISEWTNVATPHPYSIPHLTRNPSHYTNTLVGLVRPDLLDFSYSCTFFFFGLPSGHRRTVPLLQGPAHKNNEHLTMQRLR